MKRFWTAAEAVEVEGGLSVMLDKRALKTPARVTLVVPTRGLAEAIAAEWRQCGERIDPRAMPLTGLANAAIDRVAPDRSSFAAGLARYAEADLLCYRAEGPATLVERQAARWDPLLDWARRRYDVDFAVGAGILHIAQPPATVERLAHALVTLDEFRLAALAPLITIGGSLITALAILEEAIEIDAAFAAVSLDEAWQFEKWGSDAEAEAVLEARAADLRAAAHFLSLLQDEVTASPRQDRERTPPAPPGASA